jgi:hypothetical protein
VTPDEKAELEAIIERMSSDAKALQGLAPRLGPYRFVAIEAYGHLEHYARRLHNAALLSSTPRKPAA